MILQITQQIGTLMLVNSFLLPSNIQQVINVLGCGFDIGNLPEANLLCVLSDGTYGLMKINPPKRNVIVYLETRNDLLEVDVVDVFNMLQTSCIGYCYL